MGDFIEINIIEKYVIDEEVLKVSLDSMYIIGRRERVALNAQWAVLSIFGPTVE